MKIKRIIGAAVFIVGLLIQLAVLSYLFVPKNNTAEAGMEETTANGILGEKEDSIDILVLGDSESYCSVSPLQLWKEKGYTAYVCGTAAQRLNYSNTMLHRAFQHQKPKIVILETLAIYRKMSLNDVGFTEMANYFPVFQYHNLWKTYGFKEYKSGVEYNWTSDYKGYFYSSEVVPARNLEYMIPTKISEKISRVNKSYVQRIKDFCNENGAELILLSAPSSKNWNYELHNGIASLASELNCKYIDLNLMNDVLHIDWRQDTRDEGDHLNYSGAIKVTHYLSDYLSSNANLPDHRSDKNYASWNECLAKLNEKAKDPSG